MSGLRRTALSRKSELRRQSVLRRTPLARRGELRARSVKAAQRPRDTGPAPAVRRLVVDRASGACELCGRLLHDGTAWAAEHSLHHRQGRGIGGSSRGEINSPSNLMLLCGSGTTGCHGFITANPALAEGDGWIVRRGTDPSTVPVRIHCGWTVRHLDGLYEAGAHTESKRVTRLVLLTPDGDYEEIAA